VDLLIYGGRSFLAFFADHQTRLGAQTLDEGPGVVWPVAGDDMERSPTLAS